MTSEISRRYAVDNGTGARLVPSCNFRQAARVFIVAPRPEGRSSRVIRPDGGKDQCAGAARRNNAAGGEYKEMQ